ncbi:MAG: hypothetical protein LBD16_00350 [Oscillospiraceae bacterium]|nr:hypothetical protein [Oscillospiraceae bacterium]
MSGVHVPVSSISTFRFTVPPDPAVVIASANFAYVPSDRLTTERVEPSAICIVALVNPSISSTDKTVPLSI